jgi:DNA-binding transcriptional LysR family regulator
VRLRQIEVFHAVYSRGSVTKAAEALNVSQPSVSKVLAHAEQQLGYSLFDRVSGKLVPTPEAHQLFAHVSNVYDSVDRLRNVAENLRAAETGKIRIAATPAFGMDLLPWSVATYREKHSDTFFAVETLHHDEICSALLESRLDIGLAFDPVVMPGIAEETLAHGTLCVLAPPDIDLGAKHAVTLNDLADLPFIKLDNRGPLGRLLSTHIDSSGVQLNTVASVETYHVAKALVSYGAGITITDEVTAKSDGHADIQVRPLNPVLRFRISALQSENVPMSIVSQKFLAHLSNSIREFLDRPV